MGDAQLRGWKQIAAFLGTSPRTAQRWEAEFSLPVHRLGSGRRASVFAHREELAVWLESKPAAAGAAEDCAPAPVPAGEGGTAAREYAGSDYRGADMTGGLAPDAASLPARGRGFWPLVALGIVSVVLVVMASLAWVRPAGSTVQGKSASKLPDDLVMLRITSPGGYSSRIGIRPGGSAHITWRKRELVLNLRSEDGRARVEVRDAAGSTSDGPVGVAGLTPGSSITLQIDPPLTLEWLPGPHSPAW